MAPPASPGGGIVDGGGTTSKDGDDTSIGAIARDVGEALRTAAEATGDFLRRAAEAAYDWASDEYEASPTLFFVGVMAFVLSAAAAPA